MVGGVERELEGRATLSEQGKASGKDGAGGCRGHALGLSWRRSVVALLHHGVVAAAAAAVLIGNSCRWTHHPSRATEYGDESVEVEMPASVRAHDNMSSISSSIRFLISNAEAGSVIGKGGGTISELQAKSGARIQLSRNHEYFPGTTDRIILISGTFIEISTALHLILSKIISEAENENDGDHKASHVRLIVPNNVCGAIIGKGGSTIKGFVEDTGANIKLSPQDKTIPGVSDRMVTITGTLEQQLRAVDSIITKLSEDPNYAQYASSPISYSNLGGVLSMQIRGRFVGQPMQPPAYGTVQYTVASPENPCNKGFMPSLVPMRSPIQITLPVLETGPVTTSITLAVPDDRIGAIVGRGGKTITEIQQMSGVKIKISDRGDFVAGTQNRKVTIVGTSDGVRISQHLLAQKVQESIVADYER